MKDWTCVVNIDEYKSIVTHWIALYANDKSVTCFDSFGAEQIPEEIQRFIGNTNIITHIFRIQAYIFLYNIYTVT